MKPQFQDTALRTIEIGGEPWFHATDVCKCVGLNTDKGTNHHLRKVDADVKRLITPYQMRGLRGAGAVAVSASGLYRLIMRADGAKAKPFRDWVVRERHGADRYPKPDWGFERKGRAAPFSEHQVFKDGCFSLSRPTLRPWVPLGSSAPSDRVRSIITSNCLHE